MDSRTDIFGQAAPSEATFDPAVMEAFQGKALGDLAGWSAIVMSALGDRLGLFRNLAERGPATSRELSARAGISERYTREWLAALACAGYLAYDPGSRRFSLPAEHAPVLVQEGPLFLGAMMQLFQLFGANVEKVEQGFHSGEGVAQSSPHNQRLIYPGFCAATA
jgi:hypothetical protein